MRQALFIDYRNGSISRRQLVNILIFNCGSSSLTYKIFGVSGRQSQNIEVLLTGKVHRVGVKGNASSYMENCYKGNCQKDIMPIANHREAAAFALQYLKNNEIEIHYIGHRFVHGGIFFQKTAFCTTENLKKLRLCLSLAPIHNPISLSVIQESARFFPSIPQYVTFDSAFHATIPDYAYTYALPKNTIEKFGFRKYGFHGLSYSYVTGEAARFLNVPLDSLKIVACHLGTGGSSVAAIKHGRSVDTSMGYSPLPGLVMSTRCGDLDPMLTIYLMAKYGYRSDELEDILNKKSGLLGISKFSSDIRDIINEIAEGKEDQSELALNMYVHRLKKYIGSYVAVLEGIDLLLFTDDIGVHNWLIREKVCENMEWCGLILDKEINHQSVDDHTTLLNTNDSKVKILKVPTEEEQMICLEGIKLIGA
jgi:acetate kinase